MVSISASTTEALFAIGAGAQVVGRSRYCDYPPAALGLPTVGGYVDPNLEAILALGPDLVVGARGPLGPGIVRTLEDHRIATYFPETESLAQILTMLEGLGARTGHVEEARRLRASLTARAEAMRRTFAAGPHPRVLLVFSTRPISAAGPGSFADESLTLAGSANVVREGGAYPNLPLEAVVALDPDLILVAEMGGAGVPGPTWTAIRAVREGHVVSIDDEAVLRPGPRVLDGVATLAHAIHPGVAVP